MMTVAVLLGLCDGVGCGVKTTGFSGVQAARSNTVRAKYLVIRSLQSDNLRVRFPQRGDERGYVCARGGDKLSVDHKRREARASNIPFYLTFK